MIVEMNCATDTVYGLVSLFQQSRSCYNKILKDVIYIILAQTSTHLRLSSVTQEEQKTQAETNKERQGGRRKDSKDQ
jgi:hypothetical protein